MRTIDDDLITVFDGIDIPLSAMINYSILPHGIPGNTERELI